MPSHHCFSGARILKSSSSKNPLLLIADCGLRIADSRTLQYSVIQRRACHVPRKPIELTEPFQQSELTIQLQVVAIVLRYYSRLSGIFFLFSSPIVVCFRLPSTTPFVLLHRSRIHAMVLVGCCCLRIDSSPTASSIFGDPGLAD